MRSMIQVDGWAKRVMAGLVLLCGATLLAAPHVMAISNSGPDSAEFGGANASYYLADTTDVTGATSTGIPIYVDSAPTGNIPVNFWCDDRPRGVQVTTAVAGASSPWVMCASRSGAVSGTFWVPPGQFSYNADSKKYKAMIRLSLVSDSERRGFRLSLPWGGYIGYSSADNSERFAILNQDRCGQANDDGCGKYFTYTLPFAAPCSTASGQAQIIVYDPDNDASSETNDAQYDRKMTAHVQDIDTGSVQTLDISASGNNVTDTLTFDHVKGHRYHFVLKDVYTNNVIQFKLPFDSINAANRCGINNLLPSTKVQGAQVATLNIGEATVPTQLIHNAAERADYSSRYAAYQFVIPRGKSVDLAAIFNQTVGGYKFALANYTDAGEACTDWLRTLPGAMGNVVCQARTSNGSQAFAAGDTSINDGVAIRANDYALGDTVCRMVAVRSFDYPNMDTTWRRVSYPACVKIAKKPLVTIWGNDLRTGSAYTTTLNANAGASGAVLTSSTGTVGSWVEYGIIAPGSVGALASGSGLNRPGASSSQLDWSKLTFANTGSEMGKYGVATTVGSLPDLPRYFTDLHPVGVTMLSGDHTFHTFAAGVYYVDGNVTIGQNIRIPNATLGNASEISQMVIMAAGNISIAENVSQVDAWLVAPQHFVNTCAGHVSDSLTTRDCDRQLVVNGPIVAKQLLLRRTAGDSTTPAETINLRSDAYVWARQLSERSGSWVTRTVTELPPRY